MAKYQVIRPWVGGVGVKKGDVVVLDRLHPALAANVIEVSHRSSVGELAVDVKAIATEQAERIIAEAKATIDKMVSAARAEAEQIVAQAHTEAEQIVAQAHTEAEQIRAAAAESAGAQGTLTPATPGAAELSDKDRKALIVARLKELKVEFDARKSADDLAALLPAGELDALFATK